MLNKAQYIAAFEQMLLIRKFEEKCGQLYGMKLIGGFCHLYIGQEAVVAATFLAKHPKDSTITSYRDHGHIIASGIHPKYVLAELMGKATGCSKGKGGSMHLFNKEQHFYGGHGIVGAQIPIGTGLAFAEKYKGSNNISYTFLGDGAANQGQMFEAFNMAALWSLPVLYIIENNEYAMGTSVARSTFETDLYKRGLSLGIHGLKVDGMDFDKVYEVIKKASDEIRSSSFPQIIEVKTYRYKGHSMSDPAKYRTKEEVDGYKMHDPIELLRSKLIQQNHIDEDQIKEIEKRVKSVVQEAVDFAQISSEPNENELYTDIYI
jgi:pyruvate dehydrogenase E1 component alpha subunit